MKTDSSSERLLGEVLLDDPAFTADSLAVLLQEARRHQTRRHRQKAGAVILAMIVTMFGLWLLRPVGKSITASPAEPSFSSSLEIVHSRPLIAEKWIVSQSFMPASVGTEVDVEVVRSEATPVVPEISDSELLAFLPEKPVALVGASENSTAIVIFPSGLENLVLP